MELVFRLDNQKETPTIENLGGKGYNLVRLHQGGFNVPYAFIIVEKAFREFVQNFKEILGVQEGTEVSDESIEAIQKRIETTELSEKLKKEIESGLESIREHSTLENPLLAVRSSGVAEDLDSASFAGMNDTVLNVPCDLHQVCVALKNCWKSLFSRHSIEYRVRNGFSLIDTSIATVVQVMIPSESSGVVFTADPQTGSRAHLSLDGVQGLGEALVSGQVNTDHWTIRKPFAKHGHIVEDSQLGQQAYKMVSNYPESGMSKVELSEKEGRTACFTKHQLKEIAETATSIEQYYKKPMDIEFCFYDETLFILQARPITRLIPIPDVINPLLHPEKREYYCYINVAHFQMLTEAISPAGYSLFRRFANLSERHLLYMNGSVMMNLTGFLSNWLFRVMTLFKFDTTTDKELAHLIRQTHAFYSKQYSMADAKQAGKGITEAFFKPMIQIVKRLRREKPTAEQLALEVDQLMDSMEAKGKEMQEILDSTDPTASCLEKVLAVDSNFVGFLLGVKSTITFALGKATAIQKLVKKSGVPEGEAERLWSNMSRNLAKRMNDQIVMIGRAIREMGEEDIVKKLLEENDQTGILNWLQEMKTSKTTPEAEQFNQRWNQFMTEFGCRCFGEIDVAAMRYEDHPWSVLSLAMNNIDGVIVSDEEGEALRAQALENLREKVSKRTMKKIEAMLPTAKLFMTYREHPKYMLIRMISAVHRVLLRLGDLMVKRNVIDHREDVFMIQLDKLVQYERGEIDGMNFREIVKEGRAVMESANKVTLPRVICAPEGEMQLISMKTMKALKNLPANMLMGVATSAGVVEGRAVVVHDPHTAKLEKGDILVTKATDPGWTPLFVSAAAVVLEIGGPLTHGAVVAKEMNLPCVVNVTNLLDRIQTGMRIRVDGTKGTVEILEEEEKA